MIDDVLNDENFLLYAARNYRNTACTGTDEFMEDLKRIKYIKKLITRYISTGDLKERLILNHIIVLGNVFLPETLCRILYLKMEQQFGYVKPFLIMLAMLTDEIWHVKRPGVVDTASIVMDPHVVEKLREILPRKVLV